MAGSKRLHKTPDTGQVVQIPADADHVLEALGDIPKDKNVTCSRKKLKKFIQAKQADVKVEDLVQKHGLAEITGVAWSALTNYPTVSKSPEQHSQIKGETSKAAVVCSPRPATAGDSLGTAGTGVSLHDNNRAYGGDDSRDACGNNASGLLKAEHELLGFSPRYLSCTSKHKILAELQRILEESLFRFGKACIQDTVSAKGWDCAQCVELNDWIKILRRKTCLLPQERLKHLDKTLEDLLDSIVQVRHTSVHRQKVTSDRVTLFLDDAESFLKVIDDSDAQHWVSDLRKTVSTSLDDLEVQRSTVKQRLMAIAAHTKTERHRIDLEEHMAVNAALQEAQDQESIEASRMDSMARTIRHAMKREDSAFSNHVDCTREAGAGARTHGISFCTACVENLRETAFNAGRV